MTVTLSQVGQVCVSAHVSSDVRAQWAAREPVLSPFLVSDFGDETLAVRLIASLTLGGGRAVPTVLEPLQWQDVGWVAPLISQGSLFLVEKQQQCGDAKRPGTWV